MYEGYAKIIRYDNLGFRCKPYTSNEFSHVFEFIDTEITDLYSINNQIESAKAHRPDWNDCKWSGCFCFLEEHRGNLLEDNGALAMRQRDRKNIAYIPKDILIWVRNTSHIGNGKDNPYFNEFIYPLEHEGKEFWFPESVSKFHSYRWVRMKVELALERTRLWKEKNDFLPEWLTEFYLMENQIENLIIPPAKKTHILKRLFNWNN